jgi:hypothetical protein
MNTTTIEKDIVEEGWKVLVAKLGLQKATQFVNCLYDVPVELNLQFKVV